MYCAFLSTCQCDTIFFVKFLHRMRSVKFVCLIFFIFFICLYLACISICLFLLLTSSAFYFQEFASSSFYFFIYYDMHLNVFNISVCMTEKFVFINYKILVYFFYFYYFSTNIVINY